MKIRPKWRNHQPILRRELGKNRAVAIPALVIAPHYRNRNRYCTRNRAPPIPSTIRTLRSPTDFARVNRRGAIMTGGWYGRERKERKKSALWRIFEPCPRSVADRFIRDITRAIERRGYPVRMEKMTTVGRLVSIKMNLCYAR